MEIINFFFHLLVSLDKTEMKNLRRGAVKSEKRVKVEEHLSTRDNETMEKRRSALEQVWGI